MTFSFCELNANMSTHSEHYWYDGITPGQLRGGREKQNKEVLNSSLYGRLQASAPELRFETDRTRKDRRVLS